MTVWTPELENEERVAYGMKPLKYNDKGHIMVNSTSRKVKKKKSNRKPMTEAQKAAFVERMRKARENKAK